MGRVQRNVQLGVSLPDAASDFAELYDKDELRLFALGLKVNHRYGGNASELLENLIKLIREREQAARQLSAMTGETRMTALVLALLPVTVAGYFLIANPKYLMSMWNDGSGQCDAGGRPRLAGVRLPGTVADVAEPMNLSMLLSSLLFLLASLLLLSVVLELRRRARAGGADDWTANAPSEQPLESMAAAPWAPAGWASSSVKLDNETQTLLNRLGWRTARQRAMFAAFQVGVPVLALALSVLMQELFFPQVTHRWVAPTFALGIGYLLPKRLLATAAQASAETNWRSRSPPSFRCCASCSNQAWPWSNRCAC